MYIESKGLVRGCDWVRWCWDYVMKELKHANKALAHARISEGSLNLPCMLEASMQSACSIVFLMHALHTAQACCRRRARTGCRRQWRRR